MDQMTKLDRKTQVTNEVLNEAVQTILEGMDNIVVGLRAEMKSGFDKVDERFDNVETDIDGLKKETREGFKSVNTRMNKLGKSLAYLEDDTPTREEFDELKKDLKN